MTVMVEVVVMVMWIAMVMMTVDVGGDADGGESVMELVIVVMVY